MNPSTSRRTARAAIAGIAALAMVPIACSSDDTTTTAGTGSGTTAAPAGTEAPAGELTISDAWCRESAMASGNGACYLVITNNTDTDDALMKAAAPTTVAATTELHETSMGDDHSKGTADDNGDEMDDAHNEGTMGDGHGDQMMTMREVSEIPVPAGDTVKLEPGGYHVMLIDLAGRLEAGTDVELTLTFAEAGTRTVTAEVRAA